jgi:FkbM family methyltransferase
MDLRWMTVATRLNAWLKRFDIAIMRHSRLEALRQRLNAASDTDIDLLINTPREHISDIIRYFPQSTAQSRQDIFVLAQLAFKREGFFVEFGATNGIDHSNTYLLEKDFGWTGILAEPALCWHGALRRNRKVAIDTQCVWKESNQTVPFYETDASDLSTIDVYRGEDLHTPTRTHGLRYDVPTISLQDLLIKHKAPRLIDYLSIDTEGSEFDILRNFDFGRHRFRIITCEHNFTQARDKICNLLSRNGYKRILEHVSRQDDWYVSGR